MSTPPPDLSSELKATVLRPTAEMFQRLARQIDSGEYELPKTVEEAESITENYITQANDRAIALFTAHLERLRERLPEKQYNDHFYLQKLSSYSRMKARTKVTSRNQTIDQVHQTITDFINELKANDQQH